MNARLILTTGVALGASIQLLSGQTPQEVRAAFNNLRSDNIRYNCSNATAWLFLHREALAAQLERELYKTDRQGRDAILHILFNTRSYVADDRFRRLVLSRIPEQDTFVHNDDILGSLRAQWEAWVYIDGHYNDFEPLLREIIPRTDSTLVLWGATWLLAKHQKLKSNLGLYSDEVMTRAADNLANDNIEYNATFAARFFLLLNKRSIPALQRAVTSSDFQKRNLSKALLDAIKAGNHDAFGYINAHCAINRTPTKEKPPDEPDWLDEVTRKYKDLPENTPYP